MNAITWDERDALAQSWDALDARDLSWTEWEIGEPPSPPPVISGENGDLGKRYEAFGMEYTVTDASFRVEVLLDGAVLSSAQGTGTLSGRAQVSGEQLAAMAPGSPHTLTVRATGESGAVALRQWRFTAIEDLRKSAVYYLLRDGVPIAESREIAAFSDYAALGTHRYRVRAVDRFGGFSDSGEIELTTTVGCTTLAPLEQPANLCLLRYRIDAEPGHESRLETGARSYWFEGRESASVDLGQGEKTTWTLAFSAETREEYDAVRALARGNGPVVYRDPFGNRAIVAIDAVPVRFRALAADFSITMTQIEEREAVDYD